ncbi:hypothetical protein MKX01_026108, partial [Papaver californicum]
MSSITFTWVSPFLFLLLAYVIHAYKSKSNPKLKPLPPGPKGLPILGNLLMIGEFPHRDLHRLSTQYGPIFYIRLGFVPTIVVSSPQTAEFFLKTHDLNFAGRPFSSAAKIISYDQKGLTFAMYGPYWRNIRKLCTLKLLCSNKVESFRSMRSTELGLLITSLKHAATSHEIVNVSNMVLSLSTDMSCLMVFGNKSMKSSDDHKGFQDVVHEGMKLAAIFNIADYIPYVGLLDVQGLGKRMKVVSRVFDEMFEKIIDEHVKVFDKDNQKDFVDVMLGFMEEKEADFSIDRSNIKAIILIMLRYLLESSLCTKLNCAASMSSSSIVITWIASLLFFLLLAYYVIHIFISKSKNKHNPLPPGPKGLPVVGNFFMLGEAVHRDLHRLSTKYGPIMYLRLGFLPTIVVSSAEAAELFLKTHDHNFASRPFSAAAKYISYDHKGFFTEYGPYWRNVRRLSTLKLLNHNKIESFGSMRSSEMELLVRSLKDAANLHEVVDITSKIFALNKDMTCLMVFGKKRVESDRDKKSFHEVVQEGMRLAAVPNLAEYIPFVGRFDLQGIVKGLKAVSKVYDEMFDKIIDEHIEVFDKDNLKDFIDVLLYYMASNDSEFSMDRSNLKAIAL